MSSSKTETDATPTIHYVVYSEHMACFGMDPTQIRLAGELYRDALQERLEDEYPHYDVRVEVQHGTSGTGSGLRDWHPNDMAQDIEDIANDVYEYGSFWEDERLDEAQ